jgi:hypothetical protein
MSPEKRCDEIIRIIDESLSEHDLELLWAGATDSAQTRATGDER